MLYRGKTNRRRGVIAVFLVLSLVVLLGVVGLVADGGAILTERRHAQATADVAALAAATSIFEHWPKYQGTPDEGHDPDGTAKAAATKVANDNGFTDVTIHISPENYSGGPHAGTKLPPGYAEVIVKASLSRTFSAVLGSGELPAQARAVAVGAWIYAPPIWAGDLSADGALYFPNTASGNITIGSTITETNPYGGRAVVNSSSAAGPFNDMAGSAKVTALEFYFSGGHTGTFIGSVHDNARPTPDPLSSLPAPTKPATTFSRVQFTTGSQTLNPGTYVGGISVGAPQTTANLTLSPGIYYLLGDASGGGFRFLGLGTLSGSGVLLYNAPTDPSHTVTIGSSGGGRCTAILSPPTSESYQGLTIFQDRASSNPVLLDHTVQVGTNYFNITGAVYAVNANVSVVRNPRDLSAGSQFIARTIQISGTGDMAIPGNYVRQRIIGGVE
jgi:hypothetical protein